MSLSVPLVECGENLGSVLTVKSAA